MNVNNITKITFAWFLNFWQRKNKTSQGYINIHGPKLRQIHAYYSIFSYIQTYPDLIRLIQAYSKIIQAHSEHCVTMVYSELRYIQNPDTFRNQSHIRNPVISKTLVHSEPETCSESLAFQNPGKIQNRRHTQNLVKHLRWSAMRNS